jgi:hypothetical protein
MDAPPPVALCAASVMFTAVPEAAVFALCVHPMPPLVAFALDRKP